MITAEEIFDSLEHEFELTPAGEPRGSAPAELFAVDGGPATVGVIASVTRPFCGDCDRVRLTADGQVRNCLFAREESDLATALRAGRPTRSSPTAGWPRWRQAPGHGIDDVTFLQPAGRCRPSAADAARGRRVDGAPVLRRTTSSRKPRAPRKSRERLRCSSQASHVLRRSGVCSLGLFQSSAQVGVRLAALRGADVGGVATLGDLGRGGYRGQYRTPRVKLSARAYERDC